MTPKNERDGKQSWDVRDLVAVMFQADLPVLMWGLPGAGKTEFAKQLFRKCGITQDNTVVLIGSMYQPEDVGGMPYRIEELGVFDYLAPAWVLRLKETLSALFADEINTASAAMQAAMLRVIQERRVGDHEFSARVLAAANPPEVSAGGMDLAPPLANRFGHVKFDLSAEVRADGLRRGWQWDMPILPATHLNGTQAAREVVADFLVARPELQNHRSEQEFPPAAASPRTWEFVARFIAAADAVKLPAQLRQEGIKSFVGTAPAAEFVQFERTRTLTVGVDEMLSNPKAAAKKIVKLGPDERGAVFAALAHRLEHQQLGATARAQRDGQVSALFTALLAAGAPKDELTGAFSDMRPHLADKGQREVAAILAGGQA